MRLEFIREKETKRTYRYQEQGDTPKVGYLYVEKAAARELGERITVEITPA